MHNSDIADMTKSILGKAYDWKIISPLRNLIENGLTRYWNDYAVHCWHIQGIFQFASENGLAVTTPMAVSILKEIETSVDSEYGITNRSVTDDLILYVKQELDYNQMTWNGRQLTYEEFCDLHGTFVLVEHYTNHHIIGEPMKPLKTILQAALLRLENSPSSTYALYMVSGESFTGSMMQSEIQEVMQEYSRILCHINYTSITLPDGQLLYLHNGYLPYPI